MRVYLDTSAAAKLVVQEDESDALAEFLDRMAAEQDIISSALLETELRRLASRLELDQGLVSEVLDRVTLVEPRRSLFHQAGVLPGAGLRSLDALHLATALRIDAELVAAYDVRLLQAAQRLGMRTASPS